MEPANKQPGRRRPRSGPGQRKLRFDPGHPRLPKHVHYPTGKGRRGG